MSLTFTSILFKRTDGSIISDIPEAPAIFTDLNLDQIIDAITADRQEYNLRPFFYIPLQDMDEINYRYEIMQDLENKLLFLQIKSFSEKMCAMREHLVQRDKLYYKYQKESWFLDAVEIYCEAVCCLAGDLAQADLKSRGFLAFRGYIQDYVCSEGFTSLMADTKKLKTDLSAVTYSLLIQDNCITVQKYQSETDYSSEVERTFAKFKQGAVKDYRVAFYDYPAMNHIEAAVLDLVAKLYPEIFFELDVYCEKYGNYLNETIRAFDREIQFYLAYLDYVAKLKEVGLKFCYPQMSDTCKEIYSYEGFDLALANKLNADNSRIVCNDFYLQGKERIFVVSGPNQGGKTTFARAFGQMHYLCRLGCPVPGREARLFLSDQIFTHFEREEDIKNLRGKLQDDLVRIYDILDQATAKSIIIMNEIFTSTTLQDAIFLGKKVMEKIMELDSLCVCVTFIDEMASLSEKTVSMVSTVVPENPALRTYKIVRKPADGRLYAMAIAEKYRLTYQCLRERIQS